MLTIKNWGGANRLFFCGLALALAGCLPSGPRALLKGKKLLERGDAAGAVVELRQATALLTTNAQAWNYFGLALHRAGDPTNAASAYQKALLLDHDLFEAHFNLGCLWLEQNRLEPAKAEFTTYTLRRPNALEGWLRLGSAQLRAAHADPQSRELAAAEASFARALHFAPQNPEALNGIGLTRLERSRPREAVQFFEAALRQQTNYAPALLNLAIVQQVYLNNRELALKKYREYLALPVRGASWEAANDAVKGLQVEFVGTPRPGGETLPADQPLAGVTEPKPLTNLVPRGTQARTQTVASAAKTAPKLAPPGPETVRLRAEPPIKTASDVPVVAAGNPGSDPVEVDGEPPPHKKGFLQKLNPLNLFHHDTAPAPIGRSTIPRVETEPKDASDPGTSAPPPGLPRYTYLSPHVPAAGDNTAAHQVLVQGLRAHLDNRLTEAMQAYARAIQLDPAYYDAYYDLGLAAASAGRLAQALAAYETALMLRPDSADARYNFALSLKQANYPVDAANELERLLSAHPNDARAQLAVANLYAQPLRQPARAREHYLQALEADPHLPQAAAIHEWLSSHPR